MQDLVKSVKIRGGIQPYGHVTLSGDPFSAIFLITQAFFTEEKLTIRNVPRADIVLQYNEILSSLGVEIQWLSEDTIDVGVPASVSTDISHLQENPYGFEFAKLIVPALLHKHNEVYIPYHLRDEAKFYRSMGIEVLSDVGKGLRLNRALGRDNVAESTVKHVNAVNSSADITAARLFAKNLFPNMNVSFNKNDMRYSCFNDFSNTDITEFSAVYNQLEFNLFASLSILTTSDITIEGFNLSESLSFLMAYDEIAGNYQVSENKIKLWRHPDLIKDAYDLTGLMVDAVGYLVFSIAHLTNKPVVVTVDNSIDLDEMITEFNIIGCRIDVRNRKDTSNLTIKPRKGAFAGIKSTIVNPRWAGVLIYAAVLIKGLNRIAGFDNLGYRIPYLYSNLEELNINITT